MKKLCLDKKLAALICVCLVAVFILSFAYIAEHADHDCVGESCEICLCIQHAQNTLQQLGAGIVFFAFLAAASCPAVFVSAFESNRPQAANLVSLKVRLNN